MNEGGPVRRGLDDALGGVFAVLATGAAIILLHGLGMRDEAAVGLPIGVAGTIGWVWWAVRRVNRRPAAGTGLSSGEVEAIRVRIEDLELLQTRVAELEERQDFSERLLAQQDKPGLVRRSGGGHES